MPKSPPKTDKRFADLGLDEASLAALDAMGFERPTPIQTEAIPIVLEGRDVIGQARTGTGKTTAFGMPMIEAIDPELRQVQGLVLCPTRELAVQVAEEIERMRGERDLEVLAVYGGAKMDPQTRSLERGVHVVVGTPGRVMDHMRRGALHLDHLRIIVLDEADRMLDMGFIEDMEWILGRAPAKDKRQMLLFSATIPTELHDISERFMNDPKTIRTLKERLTVPDIDQEYYLVGRRNKLWALARVIEHEQPNLMLVFCSTKRMVDRLTEELERYHFGAVAIHGDLSQSRREKVLKDFAAGKVHILVATDVAARGLDIDDITHVVNYDLPETELEVYVHRIGRTGRAGRRGKAISFVTKNDVRYLRAIERLIGEEIPRVEVPGEDDDDGDGRVSGQEIRARPKGRGGGGREPKPDESADDGAAKGRGKAVRKVIDWDHMADRYGNVHFEIDVGKDDGASMVKIHKLVHKATNVPEYAIGHIKVGEKTTRFDVPKDSAHRVLQTLGRHSWDGRKVHVHVLAEEH